ncbi:unnamed protein product [Coffea canephora]|uniref:DH200=94 genomic scaffold, scaffold_236 n=1 Tax=Coffea canephora TaxID=49390 RepID=A0A068VCH3_COFCA|nr:unnamed protein product [Coffea canephora]
MLVNSCCKNVLEQCVMSLIKFILTLCHLSFTFVEMLETDRSPTTMEHEHWNTNCGNWIVQSSHVANGFNDQGLSKMSRSSSSSSSSSDSIMNIPFCDDDEDDRKKEGESFMMQSSHAIGGVDAQVSSKKSKSPSCNSSSPDSPLDGSFKDDEKHGKRDYGNTKMQSTPAIGGTEIQVCRKTSRSSSSGSSSPDSPLDGHFWGDTEEHKHTYGVNLITRSCPAVEEFDAQASSKMSRSSFSSSSSLDASFNVPFKENVKHDNLDGVNFMMQSFPAFDGLDLQASSKMSRSSSSNSSSPESPVNSPLKKDSKNHRNTNGINLMMQLPPAVDRLEVRASSRMSRSSSSFSSPDSSPKGPFEGGEKHRKTNTGDLVTQSSPAFDQVDVQVSSKSVRSSSSSSSSPDSPQDDPSAKDDQEFDKSFQSTASFFGQNNGAKIEDGKHKEPDCRKTLPANETPVSISPTEVKNHSPESNLGNMPTTESPPTQVMERPTNSPYRIPSHVFARTKSTNPVEWSVASNESLFSIHMGNMSFTRDQFLLRSEELGIIPGESTTSGQTFKSSTGILPGEPSNPYQTPTNQPPGRIATESRSHKLAVETMEEVIKESGDQHHGKSRSKGQISHSSAGSAASAKSFAFPM